MISAVPVIAVNIVGMFTGVEIPVNQQLAAGALTVLCGLVGMVYAAGSVVWEVDRWSLAGQTAAYFLITLGSVLPVAYAAYWMERSVAGVLSYVAIFCAIFAGIWISQYLGWRAKINRINKKIALDK